MRADIRDSVQFKRIEEMIQRMRRPAADAVSDAADLHVCPTGTQAAFTGTVCEAPDGLLPTRICEVDLRTGGLRVRTQGSGSDRAPRYSPDGNTIAFLETVVAHYDVAARRFDQLWASTDISTGGFGVTVTDAHTAGDFALIGEGFRRAPEIAVVESGDYRPVCSLDRDYAKEAGALSEAKGLRWQAPDGLEIQGWLLLPASDSAPYALILNIHGGPVGNWRPTWLARRYTFLIALLAQGYAIFLPNPRGSSGRGRDFARRVVGDLGGADTQDHLSGVDHLVASGLVDASRIGVTGVSYGGYMSAWLITQDARFAACAPVAPACNHVTSHLLSNIPDFVSIFLADHYNNRHGKYFSRSPIMHADQVRTPTLNICGALDRCTPPEEAAQFHSALRERGVTSVLVTYPEEGHGVRSFPSAIDYAARLVEWFNEHMPP